MDEGNGGGEGQRKLVQELAVDGGDPPAQYVLPENGRPVAGAKTPTADIPIIDLRLLTTAGDAGQREAARLRSSLEIWGLFLAVGHELTNDFHDEVLNVAREFFHLPVEEKQKYSNLVNGKEFRYEGYGNDRVVTEEQIQDWVDRLYLYVEPESGRNLDIWPKLPHQFRDILNELTIRSGRVANQILRAAAKSVSLSEDYFVEEMGENRTTHARFNYYPRCARPDLVNGLKPHSDGSIITILLQDEVGGLQVLRDGLWYNVPAVPYALVVNLGDALQILSNGVLKSPVHRVTTNADKERISVVMFYAADLENELHPAEALIDEQRPRMYRNIKTKDYIAKLFETFAEGKRAIDSVLI